MGKTFDKPLLSPTLAMVALESWSSSAIRLLLLAAEGAALMVFDELLFDKGGNTSAVAVVMNAESPRCSLAFTSATSESVKGRQAGRSEA